MDELRLQIDKLTVYQHSDYMTDAESARLQELHDKTEPLTGEEIEWLTNLYNRLFSLKP